MKLEIERGWMFMGPKPAPGDWNGKGFHPILNMTMEEIRAYNSGVSERQQGQHVDAKDKTLMATYDQQTELAKEHAGETQKLILRVLEAIGSAQP